MDDSTKLGDPCVVERQCSGRKEGPLACQELPRGDNILAKKRRVNRRQPGRQTGCPGIEIAQATAQGWERGHPPEALNTPRVDGAQGQGGRCMRGDQEAEGAGAESL